MELVEEEIEVEVEVEVEVEEEEQVEEQEEEQNQDLLEIALPTLVKTQFIFESMIHQSQMRKQ